MNDHCGFEVLLRSRRNSTHGNDWPIHSLTHWMNTYWVLPRYATTRRKTMNFISLQRGTSPQWGPTLEWLDVLISIYDTSTLVLSCFIAQHAQWAIPIVYRFCSYSMVSQLLTIDKQWQKRPTSCHNFIIIHHHHHVTAFCSPLLIHHNTAFVNFNITCVTVCEISWLEFN